MRPRSTPSDPNEIPFPRMESHAQASSSSDNDGKERAIPGLGDEISALKAATSRYANARLKLLQIEASEAGSELGQAVGKLIAAGFFGVIFYLVAIAGVLGLAERYRPGSWPIAALIVAVVHLLIALILALSGRRGLNNPHRFSETRRQLELDRQWLATNTKKK